MTTALSAFALYFILEASAVCIKSNCDTGPNVQPGASNNTTDNLTSNPETIHINKRRSRRKNH